MILKNIYSLNAEILDFGIIDISKSNDIHMESRFWNFVFDTSDESVSSFN